MMKKRTETHIIKTTQNSVDYTVFIEDNEFSCEYSLHKELEDAQRTVEEQMQMYEDYLNRMIRKYMAEAVIEATDEDTEYFIEKYKEKFAHNSLENIQRRRELYKKLLEKLN